jgi:hypothetical protein
LQIVAEALLSLVLGIIGASLKTPALKEITWKSEMKKRCGYPITVTVKIASAHAQFNGVSDGLMRWTRD